MKTLAFQMTDAQLKAGMARALELVDAGDTSEQTKGVYAEVALDYEEELARRASLAATVLPAWDRWTLVPLA